MHFIIDLLCSPLAVPWAKCSIMLTEMSSKSPSARILLWPKPHSHKERVRPFRCALAHTLGTLHTNGYSTDAHSETAFLTSQ
jgi:hypothetical protein